MMLELGDRRIPDTDTLVPTLVITGGTCATGAQTWTYSQLDCTIE